MAGTDRTTARWRSFALVAVAALSLSACDPQDLLGAAAPAPPIAGEEPAAPPAPPEPPAPPAPPAPEPDPEPEPDAGLSAEEQEMLALVNEARADAGLEPYVANAALIDGARVWSARQAKERRMYHDDLQALRGCRGAGENVAYMSNRPGLVKAMFEAWMGSQGHRENILRPQFTDFGFGLAEVDGVTYGTQRFATC